MAIIKCPECGHQVSEKAPTCPACGVRIAGNVIRCPECGQIYLSDEALCPICHHPSPSVKERNEKDVVKDSPKPRQDGNPDEAKVEASGDTVAKQEKKKSHVTLVVSFVFALIVAGVFWFYLDDANKQKEQHSYEYAIQSDDPMVLQQYLDSYKDFNEAHRDSIQSRLSRIQKTDTDWMNAVVSGTRDALLQYIKDNPNSPHEAQARNKIDSIDFYVADKAKTMEAYQAYLDEHPEGKYADQAKNEIDSIKATVILPEEEEMIRAAFTKFFQSINSRNNEGVISTMRSTLSSFLGKINAGVPEIEEFVNRLYKSDITNMNWHILNDYKIRKSLTSEGEYEYNVEFSAEQNIERNDLSQPRYQKYHINAVVDSEGKISSFNMKK